MEYLVHSREMKMCDENTISYFQVPSLVLMERAALGFTDALLARQIPMRHIFIICGTGNNGGDGMAIARLLFLRGIQVSVYLAGDKRRLSPEAKQQYHILQQYGVPQLEALPQLTGGMPEDAVIIDALFGIGLSRKIEGEAAECIHWMNQCSGYKAAVDIPSGVSADDGQILGCAFRADLTVTFGYRKVGMLLYPGAAACGETVTCDIGIGPESWREKKPTVYALEDADCREYLRRRADGHKGTFGKVLLIAGSVNMAGAAVLCAKAAYAAGCGLVRVYTPEENRVVIQTAVPEAILTTYQEKKPDMSALNEALSWADVIVLGPGLGTGETAHRIVDTALRNAAVPMVVDADALNIIAEQPQRLLSPHTELILTPHLGEMARLSSLAVSYIKENLISAAEEFAREYNVICVLKDARTVTAVPYRGTYLNTTGNCGMATAGSGDVLSGIIGSLAAQGIACDIAAPLGVYLHGRAGDAQTAQTGAHGLCAGGIPEGLQKVWVELEKTPPDQSGGNCNGRI